MVIKDNNESDFEYKVRLCKAKINREIDLDWQEIVDILGLNVSADHLRKTAYGLVEYDDYINSNVNFRTARDAEIARKKLQTEKVEYNKWLRENARDEMIMQEISSSISHLEPLVVPEPISAIDGDKGYLLTISDLHYGKECVIKGLLGETINEYSPEICEQRMWHIIDKTRELVERDGITTLHIHNYSDNIDGILRVSQLMKLRYGVVDATIKASEMLANWLNEISKFVRVEYSMCNDGNHDQLRMLGEKKGTFSDDNMNKIVYEFIKLRLKDNPNITVKATTNSMIFDTIAGYNILGHHGEVKDEYTAILEFQQVYGQKINYLIGGHKHHSQQKDVGIDAEVINVPSIIGIDDYSMSLRRSANAAAKLFVFETGNGKTAEYTFKLNK